MGWMNREPAEPELPSDLNQALTSLRQRGGRCPSPELLQAAKSDVLPAQQREDILNHLTHCSACQALLADLETLDDEPLGKATQRRIWETIQAEIGGAEPSSKGRGAFPGWPKTWLRPIPAAAMASVIILLVAGALWLRRRQQPVTETAQNHPVVQAPTIPSVLQPEKAPVVLPASAVIVWRGQQDSGTKQANALKQALAPYEKDEYAEAARRLERLRKRYPRLAQAPFYLGVCQLFLNQNQDAAHSFTDAANLAKPPLSNDVAWYLAIADHRLGKDDLASPLLSDLCKAGGKDSARACAGAKELDVRH